MKDENFEAARTRNCAELGSDEEMRWLALHPSFNRYRQVVYLYQAGYQQDAYVRFAETMEKHPTGFAIIFELLPSLEFDTYIGDIIRNNREI